MDSVGPCPFNSDGHRFQSAFGIEFHPDELWLFCERCAATVRIQKYSMLEGRRSRPALGRVPDEIALDAAVDSFPDPGPNQAAADTSDLPF